jgi:regulator of protease activity HflC (stomatin/prohibitin superfamily)
MLKFISIAYDWVLKVLSEVEHFFRFFGNEIWQKVKGWFRKNPTPQVQTRQTQQQNQAANPANPSTQQSPALAPADANDVPNHDPAFDDEVQTPLEHKGWFYTITLVWAALMLLGALIAIRNWDTTASLAGLATVSLGQIILVFQILWLVASIKMLQVNEVGAVTCFGWAMIRVGRGPKLIVFGIFQLMKFLASAIQNQFPAEPELVQKTSDDIPLQIVEFIQSDGTVFHQQKVRPIRITTSSPKAGLADDDILNSQMTVEFSFWVLWIIVDAFDFIIKADGNVEQATKQMRDVGESLLNQQVSQLTPSELVSGYSMLEAGLKSAITEKMKPWGIKVVNVGLTAPDLNHEVAKALRDIPVAKATAKKTRTEADATAYRLTQEGIGRGNAREHELAGEGRGLKNAAESVNISPAEMLASQVARDTVGEGDLILGADGITQLLGLGKALLKKTPDTNPPTTQTPNT